MKEEYVFEDGNQADDYETSLVDVLHSSTEITPAMASKKSSRTTGPARVRPYYAQQCPVCKNWYHTAAGLQRHLQRHHGMQGNEILPTVDIDTALSCAICDKHFASPQQYKLHKKRHAKIDSGNFKCTYCSKVTFPNNLFIELNFNYFPSFVDPRFEPKAKISRNAEASNDPVQKCPEKRNQPN